VPANSSKRTSEWKKLYEAALLEIDPMSLPQKIKNAHTEIASRLREIRTEDEQERSQLLFAMRVLQDLARIKHCA
jgi:hypothetical protein